MYLNIKEHPEARNYIPIDLDTVNWTDGTVKLIRKCIWADDETGKYCVYETDKDGNYLFATDSLGRELRGVNQDLKRRVKRGRIKLIKIN